VLTTPNLKALEPYISAEIMKLHKNHLHQGYVNGLNAAEEAYVKAPSTRERIALQAALKFNGGGDSFYDLHGLTKLTLSPLPRPHKSHTVLEEPRTGEPRRRPPQRR